MNDLESNKEKAPGRSSGVRPLPPRVPLQDLSWESELVQLLSTLESFRTNLHNDCLAGRTLPALETLRAVAEGVAAFARHRFEGNTAGGWTAVQASADAFFAAARPLHDRLKDTVLKGLLRLLGRRCDEGDSHALFLDAARKLRTLLKDAFVLCAGRFQTLPAARAWTETYTVFLSDLDAVIAQIGT